MSRIIASLLFICLFWASYHSSAQTLNSYTITGADYGDKLSAMERLTNLNYMLAFGDSAIIIMDSTGAVLSAKTFALPFDYRIDAMGLAQDGGVYYGGTSIAQNPDSVFMIYGKLDSTGSNLWCKKMFLSNYPWYFTSGAVVEPDVSGGGFYVASTNLLAKVNDVGDTLWTRKFDKAPYYTQIEFIRTMQNQDILVGGARDSLTYISGHGLVAKLSPQGNVIWQKTYNSQQGFVRVYDAIERPDNTIVACGRGYGFGDDAAILHLDAQGDVIKTFIRAQYSEVHYRKIFEAPGGGYYVHGGGEWILWTTNYYATISKFNDDLEHCWTHSTWSQFAEAVEQLPGDRFMITIGNGIFEYFPNGQFSCSVYPMNIWPRKYISLQAQNDVQPNSGSQIWTVGVNQATDSFSTGIYCSCTSSQPVDLNYTFVDSGFQVAFTGVSAVGTGWYWMFNDQISFAQNPVFTYDSTGIYHFTVSVAGPCGVKSLCDTIAVTFSCVDTATSNFTYSNTGVTTTFTNQSTDATWYLWDFGDGNSSTNPNPVHSYSMPGTYLVCLTAQDSCQADVFCDTITVCTLPIANFSAADSCLSVALSNSSLYSTSWLWDFGDGLTSTMLSPNHVYVADGTYDVCLTAMNMCDSLQTDTICQTVEVWTAPTAAFTLTTSGFTVTCTDNSSGATGWLWDFGDGSTTTSQNITHTFNTAGTYSICLTVANDCDTSTLCSQVVIGSIGISTQVQQEEVVLYPNPSEGTVSISNATNSRMEVTVYDGIGRLAFEKSFPSGTDDRELYLKNLSKGTYQVRIVTANVVHMKRLILE